MNFLFFKRGISLVELMVAAFILILAMLPLWGLLGSSHERVARTSDEILAGQMALEVAEQLEQTGFLPETGEVSPDADGKLLLTRGSRTLTCLISPFDPYFEPKFAFSSEIVGSPSIESPTRGYVVHIDLSFKTKVDPGSGDSASRKEFSLSCFVVTEQ
ncbi:MAG: hypothetical protein GX221_08795 [Candidatus Riflebacteria bacterium]|nr:hypothetical protein [Candidatus Riflebacteria bacterium]